ncbi:MAG: DUF6106 family protein [Eubacteriales bacterium]|nr:DUF6106 family protein [Eubacteriales bacterium]
MTGLLQVDYNDSAAHSSSFYTANGFALYNRAIAGGCKAKVGEGEKMEIMDVFVEKMISKKKTAVDYAIYAILAVLVPPAMIGTFYIPVIQYIAPVFLAGIIYGTYLVVTGRNIEFEYAVTNGEIDIDKIVAKKRRKRLYSGDCRTFDILAKMDGSYYTQDMKSISNRIEAVSDMKSEDVFFFTANTKDGKVIVFFEPDRRMLDIFKNLIPRKMYD